MLSEIVEDYFNESQTKNVKARKSPNKKQSSETLPAANDNDYS